MKRYNLKQGLAIASLIALLVTVPRIIRLDESNLMLIAGIFVYLFGLAMVIHAIANLIIFSPFPKNGLVKLAVDIVLCALFSFGYHMLTQWLFAGFSFELLRYPIDENLSRSQKLVILLFRGASTGGLVYFIVYYLHMQREKQKSEIEIEQLKQENLEARLNLLKQQISPHFLFNSLGTLRSIAPDAHTKSYVSKLANVYRYLLQHNTQHLATLENELEFANSYLYILKERYEDALQISITIPTEMLPKKVPPFALQILIENAIKHNVISVDEPLHIRIYGHKETLAVENNFRPKASTEENSGKGLQNITDRYRLLMAQEPEIIQTETFFRVNLPLL